MSGTAVQFGAGGIGRGFLAQLYAESGLEVVFVDVDAALVDALNQRRGYPLYIVGPNARTVSIGGVRAVQGTDTSRVAAELSRCRVASTAVGANALPSIAPALAAGLQARHEAGNEPLNVIVCENLHNADRLLRQLVADCLPASVRESILSKTGFVHAVVSRMVPVATDVERQADLLAVRVEAYKRLPVDAATLVGELPPIAGVEPVPNFAAHEARKLFTHNCAHSVLGYMGYAARHTYGYEALRDPRIRSLLLSVLDETSSALIRAHGFDPDEQAAHVADLLERFDNEALGDTCPRLARDPLRKLAPSDRLVGAARLCEAYDVVPTALAWAIAAALRYDEAGDPAAIALQQQLRTWGRAQALRRICGIEPGEALARLIGEALDTIAVRSAA